MNGNQVFEMLQSMTEEERERCVFPGFLDDHEYGIIANDASDGLDDDESEKVLATPKDKMAGWARQALDEFTEEWGQYIQSVIDAIADKVRDEATK